MDKEAFENQMDYLRGLKVLKIDELRKAHDLYFFKGKLSIGDASQYKRPLLEKRLFVRYCLLNWHLAKEDPRTLRFAEMAREVLSTDYAKNYMMRINHQEESLVVEKMDEDTVDRELGNRGIFIDASLEDKKQVLVELHENTGLQENAKFRKLLTRNKYYLTHILQKHPRLRWAEFCELYGRVMPNTSEITFYKTKAKMRKEGYDIPRLN
jgi:hypothetical protein